MDNRWRFLYYDMTELWGHVQQTGSVYACLQALSYAGALALLLVDILHLSAASYVPFIYFQF